MREISDLDLHHSGAQELLDGPAREAAPLVRAFQSSAQFFRLREGASIETESNAGGPRVCLALDGVLALERRLADGRRALGALYFPGDMIDVSTRPEAGDNGPQLRLVALSPAALISIDVAANGAAVSAESLSLLLERQRKRLRLATEHAVDLGKKTPPERLAAFIIELAKAQAEQAGRRNAAAARVRVPISRGDIGDYLGLKSETVSRAIRSLEREGLISLPTLTTIVVNDRSAIEALAGGGRPRKSRSATA